MLNIKNGRGVYNMPKESKLNKKEQIMQAAIKLFAKNGFEATSTRDICKLANANISLIAYYFGGKQELYDTIINSFIEKLETRMQEFINIDIDSMGKEQKAALIKTMMNRLIDYFFSSVSRDMIELALREQQNPTTRFYSPPYNFLRKILGSILNKSPDSKEVVYKCIFIISQVAFVRIARMFSLKVFGQEEFEQDDIDWVKSNVNLAINTILKEAGIDRE